MLIFSSKENMEIIFVEIYNILQKLKRRSTMKFTDKEHSYIESDEEREEGHEDTRYKNFECDNRLGCNLGIDVAG
jgi:hypothetical protein